MTSCHRAMIRAASGPPSPSRLGLRVGATPGPAALAGTQAGIDPDDRDSGSATCQCAGGPGCRLWRRSCQRARPGRRGAGTTVVWSSQWTRTTKEMDPTEPYRAHVRSPSTTVAPVHQLARAVAV
jgi:hypothetical protein